MDAAALVSARRQLEQAGLIAYEKPLYQVLALPERSSGQQAGLSMALRSGPAQQAGDILRRVLAGGVA